MNKVLITGKIVTIKHMPTVSFLTIYCRNGKSKEYIDITSFNQEFIKRYFVTGMWCTIEGHIHKNKTPKGEYKTEVIVDTIGFAGNTPDILYDGNTQEQAINEYQECQDEKCPF